MGTSEDQRQADALEKIERHMKALIDNFTGLLYMFAKTNEEYHRLTAGLPDNVMGGGLITGANPTEGEIDADRFAAMPPLLRSDVKEALDKIPPILDLDKDRDFRDSILAELMPFIQITEVTEFREKSTFKGVGHDASGHGQVEGTFTKCDLD